MLRRRILSTQFPKKYKRYILNYEYTAYNDPNEVRVGHKIQLKPSSEYDTWNYICVECRDHQYTGIVVLRHKDSPNRLDKDDVLILLDNMPEALEFCDWPAGRSQDEGCIAHWTELLYLKEILVPTIEFL